eukprot:TRINITY_DN1643_c0_g1_i1.p1 TRINITY_DN1643_c0_g1~~TRINITY_DN1643_c0_g1_i1.p1  ORF type:complete len:547 (+),score=122.90 TRINITY_DN1643_c0_g1_i1:77-1717(+)
MPAAGGYDNDASLPVKQPGHVVKWVAIEEGRRIPDDAVRCGYTKTDGVNFVGRHAGEAGKINMDENGCMHSFWSHRNWTRKKEAEILILVGNVEAVWRRISRGEPMPSNAVSSDGNEEEKTNILAEEAPVLSHMMAKLGVSEKTGSAYVGRFNGEAGMVEVTDGQMSSFWGNYWKEQRVADVLTLEKAEPQAVQLQEQQEPQLLMKVSAGPSAMMKMLQFNIWQEGWEVEDGLDKIADVIWATGADVIALSEVRNWSARNMPVPYSDFHTRLTTALRLRAVKAGEPEVVFYGSWVEGCDSGLVSRWPIELAENVTDAKRSFIAAYHLKSPLGPLLVCSAHLDWKEYALNMVRGYDANTFRKLSGGSITDVVALHKTDAQSGRDQAIRDFVDYAEAHKKPIILAGDFNECSHLDWSEATKDMYGHAGVAIDWKHSKILQESGFRDSWRELYPDPVTHMGATWPSPADGVPCTSWAKDADERDRIDFIYHNGVRLKPSQGHLVGPRGYYIKGQPAAGTCASPFLEATVELPWPSDHKGVMVEFEFSPK